MRHDGRFVRDIMKMSADIVDGETTKDEDDTTTTTATPCEAFTTSPRSFPVYVYARHTARYARAYIYERAWTSMPARDRSRVHACTHARTPALHTYYLMAPTYVFAVSRSLREQSGLPRTDQPGWFSSCLPIFFFSFLSV